MEINFEPGDRVLVNGKEGVLQKYIKKTSRWRIQLSDGTCLKSNSESIEKIFESKEH